MKRYVDVISITSADGTVTPLWILWSDTLKLQIDRVLDVRPAASLKAGGAGIRYTIRIRGQERYLWKEEERWFVEARRER